MLRLSNLRAPLDYTKETLAALLAQKLKLSPKDLLSFRVVRRSVDARDKTDVHFVLSVDLTLRNEQAALRHGKNLAPVSAAKPLALPKARFRRPPLVVGAGPGGLFAALSLARAGAEPVLVERGKPVERRTADVERLRDAGVLDPESNVQFGEGGAGAFSDGKLTCGVKSPYVRSVLETFAAHGAPEDSLVDQKPHIGTDRLRGGIVEGAVLSCRGERREFLGIPDGHRDPGHRPFCPRHGAGAVYPGPAHGAQALCHGRAD